MWSIDLVCVMVLWISWKKPVGNTSENGDAVIDVRCDQGMNENLSAALSERNVGSGNVVQVKKGSSEMLLIWGRRKEPSITPRLLT